jgi:hypothetical protein
LRPEHLASRSAIIAHICAHGGCRGAIKAAPNVWRRYQRWLAKQ